jgi:thiol-disulfide isomerase/thioredoxin
MSTIALSLILQASISADPDQTYSEALNQSLRTGKPLVVLLGADWCPACVKMKRLILPQVAKTGGLDGVAFAYVDADRQPQLASQLAQGSSIPQLFRFERRGSQWERQLLRGAHASEKVAAFIQGSPEDSSKSGGWSAILSGWIK